MHVIKSILILIFVALIDSPVSAADETPVPRTATTATTEHEPFIRQAFELAIRAGKKGNHPFGALLVHQGKVILTAENTVNTDNNVAHHAEINLLTMAKRDIPPDVLRESTMYTSTAPCMFCCAAMWFQNIKKVVYGVSYETFAKLTGFEDHGLHCDQLYRETGKQLGFIGPVLEEEGLKVFCHWPQDAFRAALIKQLDRLGVPGCQ